MASVVMSLGQVGKPASRPNTFFLGTGDHVGAMRVELEPSDQRTIRTQALIEEWRKRVRPLPGLETITILERAAGAARPRDRHSDRGATMCRRSRAAAGEVRELLGRFPGVSDIEDKHPLRQAGGDPYCQCARPRASASPRKERREPGTRRLRGRDREALRTG